MTQFRSGLILTVAQAAGRDPIRRGSEHLIKCTWSERHNRGDEDDLLTAPEVADRPRGKVSTVYAAAKRRAIPHTRVWQSGRRALVRFRRADIDRLIQEKSLPVRNEDQIDG